VFTIDQLFPWQVLDSRGRPTVAARAMLRGGGVGVTQVPSGASTGEHEAVERRDGDPSRYGGLGVTAACRAIQTDIADAVADRTFTDLAELDRALIELDGTSNKARLGANTLLAVSQAVTCALADQAGQPLHQYLSERIGVPARLPVPHFNMINGGAHAANRLPFQEFMVAPTGAPSMAEAIRCGAEVYAALNDLVVDRFKSAGVGDEGGFAPDIATPEQALDLLVDAIQRAGYRPRGEVELALDPAANGFLSGDAYHPGDGILDTSELIGRYEQLIGAYPIRSIEDGLAESDRRGWRMLTAAVGEWVQVVGDDLLVTDPQRIRTAARDQLANAALIKPNQIGTETLEALAAAREAGWGAMISHRSGETTDTFIADLAVAAGVGQLKTGAPARGERVAKYNRLLEIEGTSGSGLPYGLAY
jgi:enolase 1/2/3